MYKIQSRLDLKLSKFGSNLRFSRDRHDGRTVRLRRCGRSDHFRFLINVISPVGPHREKSADNESQQKLLKETSADTKDNTES